MRLTLELLLGALVLALVTAGPGPAAAPPSTGILDLDWAGSRPEPPAGDGDRDGYPVLWDCNDDDPSVHPFLEDARNGIDDNCDGVVDEGFDTTFHWPSVAAAKVLWPDNKALQPEELISIDATPRVVWAGEFFAAVWSDRGDRIRLARFDRLGKLLDDRPLMLRREARNPAIAWTGTRFGIVYEDLSTILPAVRLMTVDKSGARFVDVELSRNAGEPRIAWGRDQFGVVWQAGSCVYDCLNFQPFDRDGRPRDKALALDFSGRSAAIAFTGFSVEQESDLSVALVGPSDPRDGAFGIAYEASYAFRETSEVRLVIRPLDAVGSIGSILVSQDNDQFSPCGTRPSIAASTTGFALSWHEIRNGKESAAVRFVELDGTLRVRELGLDTDAGRASRIVWTGGEYVVVNDNFVTNPYERMEIHLRRIDASANSHPSAGSGAWAELNLSRLASGQSSVNPDIALTGPTIGAIWVEKEKDQPAGRIWFAGIDHR